VTGRPAFGDFLAAAHHILAAPPGIPPSARGDAEEVSRSLLRVVIILGRYLQDTTVYSDLPRRAPSPVTPWGQARCQAHEALNNAAGSLLRPGIPRWPPAPSASPLARRLDEVAICLRAGRDLLGTHFAPGPDGGRAHNSPWALAITSERLNRALLAEISALAQPIARHSAHVALAARPGAASGAGQRHTLTTACQWLWTFAAAIETAHQQHPVPAADRDLLAAIPVSALPARPALHTDCSTAQLCTGVIATAERARHLAWHTLQQPPWSPALTVTSMRQIAETATVTNHHINLLATTLAHRATSSPYQAAAMHLDATAQAARHATRTWYQTARALREVTTATRGQLTPAAAEASALATWTGRLAYTDPAWTPGTGPNTPVRAPRDLAPAPDDLPHVIAAVHHTAEAIALLAESEHEQLHRAVQARRILIPTRTLTGNYDIPRPYALAPAERTSPLLARYRDTTRSSRQTTTSIGRAACATRAPSQILATARETIHADHQPSPGRCKDAGGTRAPARHEQAPHIPGPLQQTLISRGITDAAVLARTAGLDQASQQLLADAGGQRPPTPQQPPAPTLHQTATTPALVNPALATGEPPPARLPGQPDRPERTQLEPEPEQEPESEPEA
jgi:hypothetical protein